MLLSSLLAVAALASRGSAFLVPLDLAELAKADFPHPIIDQKSFNFSLPCRGCWFDTPDDHQADYVTWPENTLSLNFTVSHEDNSLAMNGQQIYPLDFPYPLEIYAPLVRSANHFESPPIRLGFALEHLPLQNTPEGTIVPIHLSIVDLVGVPVKVPTITLELLKMLNQEVLIARVGFIPFEDSPGQECETSFCRTKALAMAHLRELIEGARTRAGKAGEKLGIKGCGGHKANHNGAPAEFREHKLPGHKRPHTHGAHPHHHHPHRHHHRLHRFVHQAMHLFVIPALLGIIGGLTASAIGMFVGQTIVFVWFRFVRGGRRGRVSRVRSEVALEEEKEALVGEDEEALPVHEESEAVAFSDEKH